MNNAEIGYMVFFASLIVDLHELIKIPTKRKHFDDVTAEDYRSFTPVEKALYVIATHHSKGRHEARNYELERMRELVRDLKIIKHYKPTLFEKFRRELIRAGTTDSFFGNRFEVSIAKGLITKSVDFDKADPPDADFYILRSGKKVFVECGSTRIRKDVTRDISYKVLSKINEKSAKPYARPTTALFIDITNLLYSTMNTQFKLSTIEAGNIAGGAVNSSGFGSIALLFYMFDKATGRYVCAYTREDSTNIDSELQAALDEIIPNGEMTEYAVVVPSEG